MKIIVVTLTAMILLTIRVSAASAETEELYSAEEFGAYSMIDSLPDEAKDSLPEGDLFSAEGAMEGFSADYFLRLAGNAVMSSAKTSVKALTALVGVLLISSSMSRLRDMFSSVVGTVFDLVGRICVILAVSGTVLEITESVREYISSLAVLVGSCVPVTAAITVAGGGVNKAAVSANGMLLGLSIVETVASEVLFPVIQLCLGLCIASGIGGDLRLGGITGAVKGTVLFVFSAVGAIVSAVMTFQTSIAARADSLSMRAVKFAASHSVPVAGSIAGEAVGAVAESLSLVKTTVGWLGVALIIMITLPVVVEVLLTRLAFSVSESAADILGLDSEKRIIAEVKGILGFMAAVCVISAIMFIYAMALFVSTAAGFRG